MQNTSPVPLLNEDGSPSGYAFAAFDITFTAPVGGAVDLLTTTANDSATTPWAAYIAATLALAAAAAYTWRRTTASPTID